MDTLTPDRQQAATRLLPVTLLLRTPVFPLNANLPSELDRLKELIRSASPAFFDQIKHLKAADLPLSPKVSYTLWKYFNRARYRPIPFNGFAAVSLLSNPAAGSLSTRVEQEIIPHRFADWSTGQEPGQLAAAMLLESFLMSNPTLYATGNEYRYTRFDKGHFSLAFAGQDDPLNEVLRYCLAKQPAAAVLTFLQQCTGWRRTTALKFLQELTHHQLLWTDRHCGIISRAEPLTSDDRTKRGVVDYIVAERAITGKHQEPPERLLAEVARFLAVHFPAPPNESLQDFSRDFTRHYELQAVPLTRLMDPQLGLGYGPVARPARQSSSPVIAGEGTVEGGTRLLELTPVILELISRFAAAKEIDMAGLVPVPAGSATRLPNTLPVLYRPYGDRIVLDHIGGCTANALLGRFSVCGPAYQQRCQDIADLEASANPGVDFFDISYQAEGHADNINRRMPIYPLELPINSWPAGDSLRLDDLMVKVSNGEIILVSAQNGKRLVPRMATAYNFARSPLSVFRLLGDLQYQGLDLPTLPDLTQLFPGQPHYSRLCYRSVILFPETWMVPGGLITGEPEDTARIKNWLLRQEINVSFRAGAGDQTLVFDPHNEEDIGMFVSFCRQRKDRFLYIAEALVDKTGRVHDQHGKPYAGQFIAAVSHKEEVYAGNSHSEDDRVTSVRRHFFPGQQWLCFEIYGHPLVTEDILRRVLKSFLASLKSELKSWFFIRYDDQGPHLRLRLQLTQDILAESVTKRLNLALDSFIHKGAVRDVKVVTYRRELERYGPDNIGLVEAFFHADSVWVLQLLNKNFSWQQRYQHALEMMREMIALVYPALPGQWTFTRAMSAVFAREFRWTAADFKKFNAMPFKIANEDQQVIPKRLRRAWLALERTNLAEDHKLKLLADLLHLHLNRLFDQDQRWHEGVLYQLLFTDMKRRFRFPVNSPGRSVQH